MKKLINLISFYFSLFCIILIIIASSTNLLNSVFNGVHPLLVTLIMTLFTFLISILGYFSAEDRKGIVRSVTSVIITMGLTAFLVVIIVLRIIVG